MKHSTWPPRGFGFPPCRAFVIASLVVILQSAGNAAPPVPDGHWPLETDAKASPGAGADGLEQSVDWDGAAVFDGRGSSIEIPHSPSLDPGRNDFSVATWVHTDSELDDILGDIACKYDPDTRRGFNLSLLNNAGVASGQSNHRNLLFGIDSGRIDPDWTDCGRPGNSRFGFALTVFKGELYTGTFEFEADGAGHVYRYGGGTEWIDCGSPDPSNSITALAVHDGELYAAASHYRSGGSAMDAAANEIHGGKIYRYKGEKDWEYCGKIGESEAICGLLVFKGKLYASSLYAPPGLYRYEGGTEWEFCGFPGGRCVTMGVHDGHLYSGGYDRETGGVARYDGGTDWTYMGTPEGVNQTYSFANHYGDLYIGTWPNATVFRFGGKDNWIDSGRLGEELEVMGMMVYNGKMYAGTLPLAAVYRFETGGEWTNTGRLDKTPDVKYRRVWTMAIHDGKLFAGTLPSGHIYWLEAGKSVTYDHALAPGWRHIVATRDGDRLKLFIDGEGVAESSTFDPDEYDLNNDSPLVLGNGTQDSLNGKLKDFRVYKKALNENEVRELFETTRGFVRTKR